MPAIRLNDFRLLVLSGFLLLLGGISPSVLAQSSTIERITSTPRSDGLGYVIRLHSTAVLDSFVLVQPSPNLIQVLLYGEDVRVIEPAPSALTTPLTSVRVTPVTVGVGLDLNISTKEPFKSRMYRDQSSEDLLIALEKTSSLEVELLTDGIPLINWTASFASSSGSENSKRPAESEKSNGNGSDDLKRAEGTKSPVAAPGEDVSYAQIRENITFDVVVLDAGHGGHDPGSLGYGGVREKDIALSVTKKVGKYIETYLPDVKVVYTRSGDTFVELHERGSIANRAKGDLFVSIHCNAHSNKSAFGSEIYFLGLARTASALETMKKENSVIRFEENSVKTELTEEEILIYELANAGYLQNSQLVAGNMEYQFNERARRRSRGVKQAGFMVLYHASMPAILVELGFISNPNEAKYLSSEYGQDIMASAIFRAIRDYKSDYDASLNTLSGGK